MCSISDANTELQVSVAVPAGTKSITQRRTGRYAGITAVVVVIYFSSNPTAARSALIPWEYDSTASIRITRIDERHRGRSAQLGDKRTVGKW